MAKVKKPWDLISKEKRSILIEAIITFFEVERGEEIGMIAAEQVLDFMLEHTAEDIYNQGVFDSKIKLKNNLDNLEVDLDLLIHQ
ncbi:DUF2164 family protein [Candidatus Falkowbacteria bacterium]|jgi:uncharacterized protein (DUF2164 family)|nr:DUF2164 family protein [Candidatus Falkowbacteria bacterium]MBT7006982.1 DUF2164 family protein [Candidatus Falkowbacteria bacterium]